MSTTTGRIVVPLLVGGNGRGAHAMLPFIERHNATSRTSELVLAGVDAAPGKGEAFAREAERRGVKARAVEATIEDVLAKDRLGDAMVVYSALDRPGAVQALLDGARSRSLPAVGYFLLAVPDPSPKLFGVRFVIRPDEPQAHREATILLDALTAAVPRGSSQDIFGSSSQFGHHLSEPVIRTGFAEHLVRNAPKVIAGLEPESPPLEIASVERVSTMRVMDHHEAWADPAGLLAELLNYTDVTLRRGGSIVIAEVGPGPGLRLHQATTRVTDGRLILGGLVGEVNYGVLAERADVARRVTDARTRQTATISRLSPVEMTD